MTLEMTSTKEIKATERVQYQMLFIISHPSKNRQLDWDLRSGSLAVRGRTHVAIIINRFFLVERCEASSACWQQSAAKNCRHNNLARASKDMGGVPVPCTRMAKVGV